MTELGLCKSLDISFSVHPLFCHHPNSQVWDRLPMTLGFMSIYSIVLHERLQLFRLLPADALTTLAAAASNPAGSDLVYSYHSQFLDVLGSAC
jgi:hypothetical protein